MPNRNAPPIREQDRGDVDRDALGLHGGGKLDLPAHPLLDCSFALAFAGFLRDLVAPLGEAMLS